MLPYPHANRNTLAFYRRLLHTMMVCFKGDYAMFHKIRIEARAKILEHKDESDEVKIQNKIFFGEEARDFMEKNVIQVCLLLFEKNNTLSFISLLKIKGSPARKRTL